MSRSCPEAKNRVLVLRKPLLALTALIVSLSILLCVAVYWHYVGLQIQYKNIRTLMIGYQRDHGGHMPPDMSTFEDYVSQTTSGASVLGLQRWLSCDYVADISTDDPYGVAVLIEAPETEEGLGVVGFYRAGMKWASAAERARLIAKPWLPAVDRFSSTNHLQEFKNRVQVQAGKVRSQQSTVKDGEVRRQ